MRSFAYPALLLAALLLIAGCSKSQQPSHEEQVRKMLERFFTVGRAVGGSADGLWLANPESVSRMIEKKYLSGYEAKPDEMKKEEIRERMKSLSLLYRIEGRQIAMLTQVADSVGVSLGTLRPIAGSKKGGSLFEARMRGKNNEALAQIKYVAQSGTERLEYTEQGYTIVAGREQRSRDELVRYFTDRLKATTTLPQY